MSKIFLWAVFPVLLAESLQNRIFLKVFQEVLNSLRYSREMKLVNAIKASLIHFHVFASKSFCHNSLINSSFLFFPSLPILLSLLIGDPPPPQQVKVPSVFVDCQLSCLVYLGEGSRMLQMVTAWLHTGAWRTAH